MEFTINFLEERCEKLRMSLSEEVDEEKKRIFMAVLREDEKVLTMLRLAREKEQIEHVIENGV